MKDDCDNYRVELRKFKTETSQRKINTLLADLLEKEEEIALYKNRLKELEAAFYYNLELISERDFELSVLEKQLAAENERLEEVSRERNELEHLIKTIDEKNSRKIQQLETRLTLKEEEIKDLERENLSNISTLKGIIEDIKQREEKKFELQKNELIKNYQQEMEQRENYYLVEIGDLARKLEQACREKSKLAWAEEEVKDLKCDLENVEKVVVEKESYCLENMREIRESSQRKVNKEVQCGHNPQRTEKIVQAEPDISVADSQTTQEIPRQEHYEQKMAFLQEQNEVLKLIIKDLKKNREGSGQPPGCECLTMRANVEQVNEKFQSEINNLKKILEKELKARAEEDAVIQSLEASVACLKDKLLLGLQERLRQVTGDDICSYIYTREIQNDVQVTLLEQKLCRKFDSFMSAAEEDRRKVHEKLEELKKGCFYRLDTYLKPTEEPTATKSENFLKKVGLGIESLENRTETDRRHMVGNNCYRKAVGEDSRETYCTNCFLPERLKCEGKVGLPSQLPRKLIKNLMAGR